MTTTARIDELLTAAGAPQVTTEQRVRFAVLAARAVTADPAWLAWAERWLDGTDRSALSAGEAAEEDGDAAAEAADAREKEALSNLMSIARSIARETAEEARSAERDRTVLSIGSPDGDASPALVAVARKGTGRVFRYKKGR